MSVSPESPVVHEDAPAAEPAAAKTHPHRWLTRTLFTLATLVGVLAIVSVWANRQVLDTNNFTNTSSALLENKKIETAVAAYSVNQLFSSGIIQSEIKNILPTKLEPAAGPISSGLEQLASQAAPRLLASPKVQEAWRQANYTAHATLIKILNGGGKLVGTSGGVVTLNLRAVIDQLASYLGIQKQVNAARSALNSNRGTVNVAAATLGVKLPPKSGRLVIMRSSELKTAQDVTSAISSLAVILPLLAIALFALAVWFSQGRRRRALRTVGWCFFGVGLAVLILRTALGNYVVNNLVKLPENRPAAHDAWAILTQLLHNLGVAVLAYGLIIVVAAWLAGDTRPARALRRALAPTLRTRPIAVYSTVVAAMILVVVWGPTPATRKVVYVLLFLALLLLGAAMLRRQAAAEFPDAQPGDTWHAIRDRAVEFRAQRHSAAGTGSIADLERLAQLHDRGVLTDSEFELQKSALLASS